MNTNQKHICYRTKIIEELKEKVNALTFRIVEVEKENIVLKNSVINIKEEVQDLKESMEDMKEKLENGFKNISNKIIAAMGTIIILLLGICGTLLYEFIIKK